MKIKTLMLGWEFPPYISGGLGTACFGLTKAMDRLGMPVLFVLPRAKPFRLSQGLSPCLETEEALSISGSTFRNIRFRTVPAAMQPYVAPGFPSSGAATAMLGAPSHVNLMPFEDEGGSANYGPDIYAEVQRYADKVLAIGWTEEFDLIHAHDWMTFPAAMGLAAATGKPLVVQIHSTEFDRSGEHVNQYVYDIERYAIHAATKVVAVSNYTRNIVLTRYGAPSEKVEVVYNGVESQNGYHPPAQRPEADKREKVVLFLGRITMQKGPEYFLYAAQQVLEKMDNVKFVMAGDGDMLYRIIELAAQLGIGEKVLFTRFLRGDDVRRAYEMADLYVMPSVSEPFGIAPLEALQYNVPALVSNQSGIAEAFHNALKVDFWDVREMANKMVAVLKYPPLQEVLRSEGRRESFKFRWTDAAARMNEVYHQAVGLA